MSIENQVSRAFDNLSKFYDAYQWGTAFHSIGDAGPCYCVAGAAAVVCGGPLPRPGDAQTDYSAITVLDFLAADPVAAKLVEQLHETTRIIAEDGAKEAQVGTIRGQLTRWNDTHTRGEVVRLIKLARHRWNEQVAVAA